MGLTLQSLYVFFCGEEKNEILLLGANQGMEAPQGAVYNHDPCDKCKALMKQGVILISVDEKLTTDENNPWRTGGWCVVKDDAIKRMGIIESFEKDILKKKVAFLPDDT